MCTIVVNMLGKFEITVLILNHLPYFQVGMDAMRIFHRLLAFACEEGEDRAAELGGSLTSNSCIDRIFTEAVEGVVLEICCGCFIF